MTRTNPPTPPSDDLERRLLRLEAQCSRQARAAARWRTAALSGLVLGGALLAAGADGPPQPTPQPGPAPAGPQPGPRPGQPTPGPGPAAPAAPVQKSVRTESLELVDAQGKPRATLGTAADGTVSLTLRDGAGKARLELEVERQGGARLALLDDARERLAVRLEGGAPAVVLCDDRGLERAVLAADPLGLRVFNGYGRLRALLGLAADGAGALELRDAAGGVK